MASESFTSPNAIPPRTSSTGQNVLNHTPSKSVLRPAPESSWMGQRRSASKTSSSSIPKMTLQASEPPDPSRYERSDITTMGRSSWTDEKEKILCGPYDYLLAHPGKDIRSQAIEAFNSVLKVPPSSLTVITKVIGMLHTSSLLIDDVEDSSILRRGVPVAHSIFGTAQTINSANYIYFGALQELFKLGSGQNAALKIYAEELENLHRGQGMDLFWRDTLTCPTEDDYLEMVGNKTGGLFRLAVKLMQAESDCKSDCVPLVNVIGIIFQIRDDYLNLCSESYTTNKGLCEDLTEGKFSFPIIHSIRSRPENLQLLNILKQKTSDEEVKKYAISYMESTGTFKYCRKVMATLLERAEKLVNDIEKVEGGGCDGIRQILKMMIV